MAGWSIVIEATSECYALLCRYQYKTLRPHIRSGHLCRVRFLADSKETAQAYFSARVQEQREQESKAKALYNLRSHECARAGRDGTQYSGPKLLLMLSCANWQCYLRDELQEPQFSWTYSSHLVSMGMAP